MEHHVYTLSLLFRSVLTAQVPDNRDRRCFWNAFEQYDPDPTSLTRASPLSVSLIHEHAHVHVCILYICKSRRYQVIEHALWRHKGTSLASSSKVNHPVSSPAQPEYGGVSIGKDKKKSYFLYFSHAHVNLIDKYLTVETSASRGDVFWEPRAISRSDRLCYYSNESWSIHI